MIAFYFPISTESAGGVQNLILNIVRELSRKSIRSAVITGPGGYIQQAIDAESLDCVVIDYRDPIKPQIAKEDVVVFFGALEPLLNDLKGVNARLLYWSVFPDTMIQTFKIRIPAKKEIYSNRNPLSKYYTRRLARTLALNNSAFFMDESHLKVLETFGIKGQFSHANLLPIPIRIGEKPELKNLPEKDEPLRLAYIGRAEDWKMFPFVSLIRDLDKVKTGNRLIMDIISEDPEQYLAFLQKHYKIPDQIGFELHNNLSGKHLTNFLHQQTHLLFTMGTSLLEGCKTAVPAIITDPAYKMADNSLYRFVSDEKGFCLGLPAWIYPNSQGSPLQEIFDNFLCDNARYHQPCSEAYNYAATNHNVEIWIERFIQIAEKSKVKILDMEFAYKFFAIKRSLYKTYSKNSGTVPD